MSTDPKKVPLIALTILITVPVTITITYGISTGLFADFFGLTEGETALINGTLVGTDNKTYNILVSSVEVKPNLTLINTAVLDIDNKTYHIKIAPKVVTQPPVEPPVPPTCPAGQFYNTTSKQCQPNPVPPQPQPVGKTMKVIMLGDVDSTTAGISVFNAIKGRNADLVAVLGDLGYDSNLNWFKSTYGTLGNKLLCVPGNHDAPEDGSSSIYTETKKLCGEAFFNKKFNKNLLIGVDTNGDLASQQSRILARLGSADYMKNITTVHIMSHKPCAVPPESHHPVESNVKAFCDAVTTKAQAVGVKIFFDQAHNHVMSASGPDGTYKQSGAGGKSHYTCPDTASTAFPFCNDSNYGFLEYTIKPDGVTTYQFIDYNGRVLYSK